MEEYYFLSPDNQRMGPVTLEQLLESQINGDTLIWKKGLTAWTPAKEVPEVAAMLAPTFQQPEPQVNSHPTETRPCPPTNLVWGILSTILCCLPLGIVSIYYSTKVEKSYFKGDYDKALKYSDRAANWCIASITISLLLNLGYFAFFSSLMPLAILMSL